MIGYKNDPIFLLSEEEYELYKNVIPEINEVCWLRSPSLVCNHNAMVVVNDHISDLGIHVSYYKGVRPVLKGYSSSSLLGTNIIWNYTEWTIISENLLIATKPITEMAFLENLDDADGNANDYENSDIRHLLLNWYWDNTATPMNERAF